MTKEKTIIANVMDRSERNFQYGYLVINGLTQKQVQDKINNIVSCFEDENSPDFNDEWTIYDVMKKLPNDWDVKFISKIYCITL